MTDIEKLELYKSDLERDIAKFKAERDELSSSLGVQRKDIEAKKQAKSNELKAIVDDIKTAQAQLEVVNADIAKREDVRLKRIEAEDKDKEAFKTLKSALAIDVRDLKDQVAKAKAELPEIAETKKEYQSTLDTLNEMTLSLTKEHQGILDEIDKQLAIADKTKAEVAKITGELEGKAQAVEVKEAERKELERLTKEAQSAIAEYDKKNKSLDTLREDLSNQIKDYDVRKKILDKQEADNKRREKEIKKMRDDLL